MSRTGLFLILPICVVLSSAVFADSKEKKNIVEWVSSQDGFERARKEKLPVFLVWAGDEDADGFDQKLTKGALETRSFIKRTKKFVAIKVAAADEADVVTNIGKLSKKSSIILLDFNGGIHHRWRGEVPARTAIVKEMKKTKSRNDHLAQLFTKAESLLKKSRYAAKLKKYKDSVTLLLQAEKLGLPPESGPVKESVAIREILDEAYREKAAEARELEREKKLSQALEKYQQMRRDFPFPERVKELDHTIARIMRQLGFGQ